jgi:SAM-dependent methyltransferase
MTGSAGTGPGPIAPDGCAVDFYALLPAHGEPEIVHAAIPAGASVLELGCGTGRILRALAALGHPVTGVDESSDMLARASDLETICSPIQALRLERRFDAVLLASTLVNTPDPAVRAAMLDAARRHTAPGGRVVIQCHAPEWFDTVRAYTKDSEGIRYTLSEPHRDGPLLTATIGYEVGQRRWSHTFTAQRLDREQLAAAVRAAGFGDVEWLTGDGSWLAAPAV